MCHPRKVHEFTCGHFILDKPEDACEKACISTHEWPAKMGATLYDPCEELLLELAALGGRWGGTVIIKGIRIEIEYYPTAANCEGYRKKNLGKQPRPSPWKEMPPPNVTQKPYDPDHPTKPGNIHRSEFGKEDSVKQPSFWTRLKLRLLCS